MTTETTKCFVCGYGMLNRGSCFCSDRCRNAFDSGFPPYDPNQSRVLAAVPLDAWIIVGPPGVEIGSRYWAQFFGRPRRLTRRRKASSGALSANSKFVENTKATSKACRANFANARSSPNASPPSRIADRIPKRESCAVAAIKRAA
jgi:hypothetical protein